MLEIRLLGQFQLQLDGRDLDIPSRPAQSLFAYLALQAGTSQRRERLAGLLWPESDEANARRNLRQALWYCRKGLGSSANTFLLADDIHITFNADAAYWLDTAVLQGSRQTEWDTGALLKAVQLYRGELLPGFYHEWVALERERFQAVFEQRMQQLLDQLTVEQRWHDVLEWSEQWIALGHTPEPAYRALMVAHASLGDSSGMAGAYYRCVEALQNELGVEPSPQTQTLYERLTRGEMTAVPTPVAGFSGKIVGAYRVVEKLGSGGMAEVYKAYQPRLDRYVALKFIHAELVQREDFLPRFEREARLLARLSHPHIIPVYDFGETVVFPGRPPITYLAMQYVPGGTLKEWLAALHTGDQPPPLTQAGVILQQVATALDYAHSQGIVHRDVKPANIILTADNQAMLGDFGLARWQERSGDMSQTGIISGTPAYISPEQIRGEPDKIGTASDLYSLGVVLYEMVTGEVPFTADTATAVLIKHLTEATPLPSLLRPELPPMVEAVLLKALAKEPADRYPTAGAMAQAYLGAIKPLPDPSQPLAAWPQTADEAPAPGHPPFKGLHSFNEVDAPLFFGREALTARLLNHLQTHPFLAIVGASGSGKSSLVRAGLIPTLKAEGNGRVHLITPTARPLESIAISLTQASESVTATATLMDDLAQEPRSLHLTLQRLRQQVPGQPITLVVDQFEELFTLCRAETERRAFVSNLLLAADKGTPIILILRADFYAHCAAYAGLRAALEQHQAYIGPMTLAELRRAVEEPAQLGGWQLEPGLTDFLLQEVSDEPGGLPLLSHALLATWERRRGRTLTFGGYAAAGGVRGAIAKTAETTLHQFSSEQQQLARHLFLRLTEPGAVGSDGLTAPDTRRRVKLAELVTLDEDETAVPALLNSLAAARLITVDQETVEVAHEALIREWPTLRGWLDEDRESLHLHRHLTETAQAWEQLEHDPGELYRGLRLAQANEWAASHAHALNPLERDFLATSQAMAAEAEAEREAQRQRELAAAQKLAVAEKARADEQAQAAARLRLRALGLTAVGLLAILLAVAALILGQRAANNARQAESEARTALARELAAASINNTAVDAELSTLLALEAIDTTFAVDGSVLREAENALHQALPGLRTRLQFQPHTAAVNEIALTPDGTRLATVSNDKTAKIWDIATGEELLTLNGHEDWVWTAVFSADGRWLATGSRDTTARIWDTETGQELLTIREHEGEVFGVAFSPDSRYLVTGDSNSTIKLWQLIEQGDGRLSASPRFTFNDTGGSGFVVFSPDGNHLAIDSGYSDEPGILVWTLDSLPAAPNNTLSGSEGALVFCCHGDLVELDYSPDGSRLVTGSNNATARLWDAATGAELLTLYGHGGPINGAAFSPDGTRLVTSSGDGTARVWSVLPGATGAELQLTLSSRVGSFIEAFFLPDEVSLLSASEGGTVTVWDITPSHEVLTLSGYNDWLWSAVFSSDGRQIATGGFDAIIKVWDSDSGIELFQTPPDAHMDLVNRVAFSPDGRLLATASNDATIKLWQIATGRELRTLTGHSYTPDGFPYQGVGHILFTADGTHLFSSGGDGTVRLWEVSSGAELWSLPAHEQVITYLGLDSSGTRLATVGFDARARLWDVTDGTQPSAPLFTIELPGQERGTWGAALSPDGSRLAITERDGQVSIWDVSDDGQRERPLLTLIAHTSIVPGAAFSPDGQYLATASFDGTVRVWDTATGAEQLLLTGHDGGVTGVAFSPDGTQFLSTGQDGTARLYVLPIADLIDLARARLTRTWTNDECQRYLHLDQCP